MATTEEILDTISGLTVLELSELLKAFEERFGVTAAAPFAVSAPGVAAPPSQGEGRVLDKKQEKFYILLRPPPPAAETAALPPRSRTSSTSS